MWQAQKRNIERVACRSDEIPAILLLGVHLRDVRLSSTKVMECYDGFV